MPNVLGRQVFGVYQFQSAFDTFPSSGNWQTLSAYDLSPGETRADEEDPQLGRNLHNNRDPYEPAPALPQGGGPMRVPMCLNEMGWWLKCMFGAPVTTGSNPDYTHVFTSGKDTLPTLAQSKKLAANDYRRIRGLGFNTMRIRAAKEGGYPVVDLETVLRDEALASADPTGTIVAAMTQVRAPAARGIARWEGAAFGDCMMADMSIGNNMAPYNTLSGDEYPSGWDLGATGIGGSAQLRYKSQTFAAIADARTPGLFELEWALSSVRKITWAINRARLARQGTPVTGPGAVDVTYSISAEQTVSAPAVTVTLKNGIASY